MSSKVNPERLSLTASGDTLVFPLREQLGVIRDELTALEETGGGAFWFGFVGGDIPSTGTWTVVPVISGGTTGNQDVAEPTGSNGLRLKVEAIAQIKFWANFGPAAQVVMDPGVRLSGNGIAILIDKTAEGQGTSVRGEAQLLSGEPVLQTAYDGWLSAGTIISGMVTSEAGITLQPDSYITVIIAPV